MGGGICSSLVCDHASLYLYQTPDRRLVVVAQVAAAVVVAVEMKGCVMVVLGILRSDNGDVHENVTEKYALHPFKLFRDYPKSPRYLKEGNLGLSSEEMGPCPSSDRDGRIYHVAVPVLK